MVIHRHGGPEVLTLERAWPRPEPGRTGKLDRSALKARASGEEIGG